MATQNNDNSIKWEFYVTSPRLKTESQLLASGTTNAEITEGRWTYYAPSRFSQAQQKFADLDWTIEKNQGIHIILKPVAGSSFEGSKLDYTSKDAIRHFVLNDALNDKETTIEFNADTKAGFILSSNYNKGKKACRDSNFENVACS